MDRINIQELQSWSLMETWTPIEVMFCGSAIGIFTPTRFKEEPSPKEDPGLGRAEDYIIAEMLAEDDARGTHKRERDMIAWAKRERRPIYMMLVHVKLRKENPDMVWCCAFSLQESMCDPYVLSISVECEVVADAMLESIRLIRKEHKLIVKVPLADGKFWSPGDEEMP